MADNLLKQISDLPIVVTQRDTDMYEVQGKDAQGADKSYRETRLQKANALAAHAAITGMVDTKVGVEATRAQEAETALDNVKASNTALQAEQTRSETAETSLEIRKANKIITPNIKTLAEAQAGQTLGRVIFDTTKIPQTPQAAGSIALQDGSHFDLDADGDFTYTDKDSNTSNIFTGGVWGSADPVISIETETRVVSVTNTARGMWTIGKWKDGDTILDLQEVKALADAAAAQIGSVAQGITNVSNALEAHKTASGAHEDIRAEIENEASEREAADATLQSRIDGIEALGHYAGAFDTIEDIPDNKSGFPNGITINDFINIREDENHDNAITRYIVSAIDEDGVITWVFELVMSSDISGKADLVADAVEGNFASLDADGNPQDSGKKPSDFEGAGAGQAAVTAHNDSNAAHSALFAKKADAQITLEDQGATTTLPPTAAAVTIAAVLQNIRNNLKTLFSYFTDGSANKAVKLATARKLKTDLSKTAEVTFDGSADQNAIPITGTLPLANGGTGATTQAAAQTALGLAAFLRAYLGEGNGNQIAGWDNTNKKWVPQTAPTSGVSGLLISSGLTLASWNTWGEQFSTSTIGGITSFDVAPADTTIAPWTGRGIGMLIEFKHLFVNQNHRTQICILQYTTSDTYTNMKVWIRQTGSSGSNGWSAWKVWLS